MDNTIIDIMNPPRLICIGRKGENVFREVPVDVSGFVADHPNGTVTAMYQSGENEPFPVVLEQNENVYTWRPRSEEITDESGRLEIILTEGNVVGASKIIECNVDESLIDGSEHPAEAAPAWSVEMVQDVTEQADRAEAAVSHYPQIVNGVWYVWDAETGEFVSTGISAQGEDGYSPTVTVTEIEGGHRVTITDADGAHTFDIMDGEGGGSGAVESVNGKTGAVVLEASDVGALPANTPIPAAVTEQTVAGWGFTKNTGTYSKPSGGIPATDLASAVQTSLGKADTALQSAPVTSVNNKTGAVTVKTPYYLTVTDNDGTITVDKTPSEIDALSAAGYDVHMRYPSGAEFDMRYVCVLDDAAHFTGSIGSVTLSAIVSADKSVSTTLFDYQEQLDLISSQLETEIDGVTPFEIPFVKQSDESWVFDPNSTLTPIDVFNGIKNAKSGGGVVAKVVTPSGEVLFYRALDALAEDGEPEDNPAALAEFIEFPFGDDYYYSHYIQVNPYDPDSDYWIETESNRTNFAQSTYVDSAIASALASTQTYFVRGIASAASLLTSSGASVSYADLVNAQKENNNVEITAAMFDLNYNARFKISEMLFSSQTGKSTVVLTDVTATQVVVVTLIGTGETGALTGTVTTTLIPTAVSELTNDSGYQTAQDVQTAIAAAAELPTVTAADNGKFLRVVSGAWAAETVQTWQGGSY